MEASMEEREEGPAAATWREGRAVLQAHAWLTFSMYKQGWALGTGPLHQVSIKVCMRMWVG
jgi:hypothetical protein